jgi:hypothetical protein
MNPKWSPAHFLARCLPLALLSSGIPLPTATAADDTLPKAEEILDRHIEATGGKEAYAKITSRRITGTLSMPAQAMEAQLLLVQKPPNMRRLEISMKDMGTLLQVCDGKHAWEVNERSGSPRLLEGDEAQTALRNAVFQPDLHWRELYDHVETVGVEDVDDKPAYKVVLASEGGEEITNYYDKQSGRMVRSDRTIDTPMGSMTIQSYPGEYKQIDGIWLPTSSRQVVAEMNMKREFKFQKIEHNIDLPEGAFEPPPEIKRQIEQAEKPAQTQPTSQPKQREEPGEDDQP